MVLDRRLSAAKPRKARASIAPRRLRLRRHHIQHGASAGGNRKGYAGYEFDGVLAYSIWHVRERILNSDLGRWMSRDALGYAVQSNLYGYSRDNPLTATDPTGGFPILAGLAEPPNWPDPIWPQPCPTPMPPLCFESCQEWDLMLARFTPRPKERPLILAFCPGKRPNHAKCWAALGARATLECEEAMQSEGRPLPCAGACICHRQLALRTEVRDYFLEGGNFAVIDLCDECGAHVMFIGGIHLKCAWTVWQGHCAP